MNYNEIVYVSKPRFREPDDYENSLVFNDCKKNMSTFKREN